MNADGVPYEWICEGEPVEAPRWLLVLLNGSATPAGAERRPADKTQGSRSAYAAAALADESEKVRRAANGQRNETLNCAAFNLGQLVGANAIDRAQVEGALLAAAMASGLVADDGEEAVRRTLKSGLDAGMAQPRDVPAFRRRVIHSHGGATADQRDLRTFDQTEDGIALAFAQAHKGDLRFCHHAGKWYVWTGARQFKLVIVGNHKPVLRNVDDAAKRRFNIIPFVHKPHAPDKRLETKLMAEWPAILAWAIEGAIDWQRNGLVRPAVVADATAEYFTEQDSVRQWEKECCETGGRTISDTTANLFASWSAYAQANGEKPGSTKWFSQVLQRHGYQPVAETPGHRKKRGFLGITVKPVDTSQQWQNRMEADDDATF